MSNMLNRLVLLCIIIVSCISKWHVTCHSSIRASCPCPDPSLCKPITKTPRREIFTFILGKAEVVWTQFNWTKITTVVSGISANININLTCFAHKHGARSTVLIDFPISYITDAVIRKSWVQYWLQVVQENFLDGVNMDLETAIPKSRTDLRDAVTLLMKELTTAFKGANPNYQVTIDVPFSPNCIYGRCYDYLELANYTDFLLVMDYDEAESEIIASPNSGFYQCRTGLDQYLKLGVPKEKIVMAYPWYGYSYPCKHIISPFSRCQINTEIKSNRFTLYGDIMDILMTTGSPVMWDDSSLTPYFNYKYQNYTYQMRYDNPTSLKLKYEMSVTYQIRGVGMWNADYLDYLSNSTEAKNRTTEMWQALPDYHANPY